MGGRINTETGKWRSEAERQRAQRARRKALDPGHAAAERERVAAYRAGQRREMPAPIGAPPPPARAAEAPVPSAVFADWDAKVAARREGREARRASRKVGKP